MWVLSSLLELINNQFTPLLKGYLKYWHFSYFAIYIYKLDVTHTSSEHGKFRAHLHRSQLFSDSRWNYCNTGVHSGGIDGIEYLIINCSISTSVRIKHQTDKANFLTITKDKYNCSLISVMSNKFQNGQ